MSRKIIHRMSGTPEYKAYIAARQRCTNPKDKRWLSYGARGVKFLFKSVKEFMKAVGPRPSSKHSLDRYPNNDGNYEQGNVRWATRPQQQNNKGNNTVDTHVLLLHTVQDRATLFPSFLKYSLNFLVICTIIVSAVVPSAIVENRINVGRIFANLNAIQIRAELRDVHFFEYVPIGYPSPNVESLGIRRSVRLLGEVSQVLPEYISLGLKNRLHCLWRGLRNKTNLGIQASGIPQEFRLIRFASQYIPIGTSYSSQGRGCASVFNSRSHVPIVRGLFTPACLIFSERYESALNGCERFSGQSVRLDHLVQLARVYQGNNSSNGNSCDLDKKIPIFLPGFCALFGFGLYSYSLWQVKPGINHGAFWFISFFVGLALFMYGVYGILRWVVGGF